MTRATASEREQHGRSRRNVLSRAAHAAFDPKQRKFDPVEILRSAAAQRVPQLLPVKYGRMRESPFAFFRGSVSIFAADLGALPHTGLMTQLCGDAHVQNLGSFAAPDGEVVFDLNDFDETIRGPWEWDVKRMAASIVLAGLESSHTRSQSREAAEEFAQHYCASAGALSRMPVLQAARYQIRREKRSAPIQAAVRQSQRARPGDLLAKLTQADSHGRPRFRDLRPNSWRLRGAKSAMVLNALAPYRQCLAPERRHLFDLLQPVDVGFKVAGTGSVGLRNYVVLMEGNGAEDPVFLQIKQTAPSAYAQYLPSAAPHQGRRAAEGQRAMQTNSDLLLGWTNIGNHDYLVRQLNDHKGSVDLKQLRGAGLKSLALVAGELLARGHARSGDAREIGGYCGSGEKMAKALADFAVRYADQTEADYGLFVTAIKNGKIRAADDKRR